MIILFSFFPRQRVSSVLTLVVIISILLQAAGCTPGPTEPLPDPNIVAISQLTENMTDEDAPNIAEAFEFGLDYLLNSVLLKACLPENDLIDMPNVIGSAMNRHWNGVSSTAELEQMLLSDEMTAVYTFLDSAEEKCDSGDIGESGSFGQRLVNEARYIDNDYFSFSNPWDELQQELNTYLTCMADTDRFVRDSCGPNAADETGVEGSPQEDVEEEPEITLDEDEVVIWEDENNDNEEAGDPDPGPPLDTNEEAPDGEQVNDPLPDSPPQKSSDQGKAEVILIVTVTYVILCTAAGGGASAAVCAAIGVYFGNKMTTPSESNQMCRGPLDNRLASEHPLQGANYQIDGEALGTEELYNECTCLGIDSNDPDPRTWGCKSEAEQRRDCVRNPYGPDDAPRPVCVDLLYEDNGIEPPDQCTAAMCPSPYTIINQEQCTCGLPSPQGGVVPDPNVQDACVQTQCGPDSVPMVVNSVCGCVPIGGPGEGPGAPPEIPPELP